MAISVDEQEKSWVQKYRPQHIEEVILPEAIKKDLLNIVKKQYIPNMILASSTPGTGKTTVAKALCNDCNVDMLFVNASEVGIDFFRNELTRFASTASFGGRKKVIVLDEFDRGDSEARQKLLRPIIELYSKNCSFIITVNDLQNVIEPIQSRCPPINFTTYSSPEDEHKSKLEVSRRCISILELEKVDIQDKKVIVALVKQHFPDIRHILGLLQKHSNSGIIDTGILNSVMTADSEVLLNTLKTEDFIKMGELAIGYALNYSDFITKVYDVMYKFCKENGHSKFIPRGIEIIADSQRNYKNVANLEIEIKYLLVQLMLDIPFKDK